MGRIGRLKRAALLPAAAATLVLAAGPGHADAVLDKLYEEAKSEGKVSLLSAPNNLLRSELTAAFTARFPGITLEYSGMSGNQMASKLATESRGGVHSIDLVISGTTTGVNTLKPQGLLQPLDPQIVSPAARAPDQWMGGGLAYADSDKTVLAMTLVILTPVITNTDIVKPGEILSDKDLLDPKWKGKIISNNPAIPGAANTLYRYFYDTYGPDYIKALKAQDVVVTNDLRQIVDFVIKGRYAVGIGASGQSIAFFTKQGVKNLGTKEGATWKDGLVETPGFGGMQMPKAQPHSKAAKLLANWLLTQEGQTALVKGLQYPSRRLDVSQEPVPEFLRSTPGRQYIPKWDESFLKSPNQKKMNELLNEIKFSQQ